jgi:hypothetical protein
MLDNTSKYLAEGDILIIAPEYNLFFGNNAYGGTELTTLFYLDPSICKGFNIKQVKTLIFGTKNLLRDYLLSSIRTENQDYYKTSGFIEYGDYVEHWSMQPRPYKHASLDDFKTINMRFLDYYKNAVEALRNRGVQVVIIPPSIAETSYKMIEDRLTLLFSEFDRRDLSFAIPPQESAYPDSLFFDSYYHLGYEGVLIRTKQLIRVFRVNP